MDFTSVANQTLLVSIILLILILIGVSKTDINFSLTKEKTIELKGFAILSIIFAHIGYFLVPDNTFLFPLSTLSGAGVNLFLFLSGYGLIATSLKSQESILTFYKKRLLKLFIPLWLVLTLNILADKLIYNIHYPYWMIVENYLGFFSSANPRFDLNSPLWYFSLILFFYLLFPIFLNRKKPYITAILLCISGFILINLKFPATVDIYSLYRLHFLAFPIGILTYYIFSHGFLDRIYLFLKKTYPLLILISIVITAYTTINSNVGSFFILEQVTSLFNMFAILTIFLLLPIKIPFLKIIGILSYEIYLIHWPILSKYDPLYSYLPIGVATVLSISILLLLGTGFQRLNQHILTKVTGIKTSEKPV